MIRSWYFDGLSGRLGVAAKIVVGELPEDIERLEAFGCPSIRVHLALLPRADKDC